jgi:DNA-binding Lrp family transcriptional regulator
MHSLDPTDIKLLQHLQQDGRISERQLAARVYRSPPAVHDRLVKLWQLNVAKIIK